MFTNDLALHLKKWGLWQYIMQVQNFKYMYISLNFIKTRIPLGVGFFAKGFFK